MKRSLIGVVLAGLADVLAAAPPSPARGRSTRGAALADDPVYVDPGPRALSAADAESSRAAIQEKRAGPMYIAILPASAAREAGGDADQVLPSSAPPRRRRAHTPWSSATASGRATGAEILPRGAPRAARPRGAGGAPRRGGGRAVIGLHRPRRAGEGNRRWEQRWERRRRRIVHGLLILLGIGAGGIGLVRAVAPAPAGARGGGAGREAARVRPRGRRRAGRRAPRARPRDRGRQRRSARDRGAGEGRRRVPPRRRRPRAGPQAPGLRGRHDRRRRRPVRNRMHEGVSRRPRTARAPATLLLRPAPRTVDA